MPIVWSQKLAVLTLCFSNCQIGSVVTAWSVVAYGQGVLRVPHSIARSGSRRDLVYRPDHRRRTDHRRPRLAHRQRQRTDRGVHRRRPWPDGEQFPDRPVPRREQGREQVGRLEPGNPRTRPACGGPEARQGEVLDGPSQQTPGATLPSPVEWSSRPRPTPRMGPGPRHPGAGRSRTRSTGLGLRVAHARHD